METMLGYAIGLIPLLLMATVNYMTLIFSGFSMMGYIGCNLSALAPSYERSQSL